MHWNIQQCRRYKYTFLHFSLLLALFTPAVSSETKNRDQQSLLWNEEKMKRQLVVTELWPEVQTLQGPPASFPNTRMKESKLAGLSNNLTSFTVPESRPHLCLRGGRVCQPPSLSPSYVHKNAFVSSVSFKVAIVLFFIYSTVLIQAILATVFKESFLSQKPESQVH